MQFLRFTAEGTPELRGHPGWFSGTSETPRQVTADELVDLGWGLKVLDVPPAPPGPDYAVVRNPVSMWQMGERTATTTYTVTQLPIEVVRERMPRITPRQLRLTLLEAGINPGQINTALNGNQAGQIEWEYASEYVRTHPLISQLAATLSLSPEQVDTLWTKAVLK